MIALLLSAVPCFGQKIPGNIKIATDAAPYLPVIKEFVQDEVKALSSNDANAQQKARQVLIEQTSGGSIAFLDAYASEIDNALAPLAKSESLRIRLNAAIANGEIAKKAGNHRQAKATVAFSADKTDPVSLWGLKAAKYEIPAFLQVPAQLRNVKLMSAVVDAVKAHSESSPVIEEAYQGLTLGTTEDFKKIPSGTLASVITDLLPDLYRLYEYRISLYANGVPTSPATDNNATLFLARGKVWAIESPAQQQQTLNDMASLVAGVGALLTNPNVQSKGELLDVMKSTGRAFQVIADTKNDPALKKVAEEVAGILPETTPQKLSQIITELNTAIKGPASAGQGGRAPIGPAVETSSHFGP